MQRNGGIFEVGGGWASRLRWERTKGATIPLNRPITVENIRDNFSKINDFSNSDHPTSSQDSMGFILENLKTQSANTNSSTPSQTQSAPKDDVESIFEAMKQKVDEQGAALVSKVQGVYLFKVGNQNWTVDLKNGNGSVSNSAVGNPDITLTSNKEDFIEIFSGKINPQQAFMQGKLKIAGNMSLAMKLSLILNKQQSKM